MKLKLIITLVLGLLLVLSVGCRTNPVYDVQNAPVPTTNSKYSLDDMRKAIERAGIGLGWKMHQASPGHLVGTLHVRTHMAQVDIRYNRKSYDITYKDSEDLNYDGAKIHSNYNGWIQNLDRAIQRELLAL